MNTADQLYEMAIACKGRIRPNGWWSPWYVRRLRNDTAERFRLFRALPKPRLPRVDQAMRQVLQALDSALCGFRHDREHIAFLFFALHNLPGAYLPQGHPRQISEELALEYAQGWLEKANIHLE